MGKGKKRNGCTVGSRDVEAEAALKFTASASLVGKIQFKTDACQNTSYLNGTKGEKWLHGGQKPV